MIGKTLGHYEILEKIGAGGMGEVYLARDARLRRTVAVKVIGERVAADPNSRARLLREARTASVLNHPNICIIHDVGETDRAAFIVMEHIEGQTLSELVPREGLPPRDVASIGAQLADGLAHAHDHGIVHRDLKASNVVVTGDGRAKILDFGLARRSVESATDVTQTMEALTEPGMIMGTMSYMAPELLRGEAADSRSDIWALGVILFEMATGSLPFPGRTSFETSSAILKEPPRALPDRVGEDLRALVLGCLVKDRSRRIRRAGEVKAALTTASSGSARPMGKPTSTPADARPASERTRGLAVLPLENLSGDTAQDYFADGMTEAITARVAKLGTLRVVSRTSAMQYKGSRRPLPEIASELNVDMVVEGSVLRSGDRVRITAQLIRVAGDESVWAETYDRDLRDILELQSDVSRSIVEEIQGRLTPSCGADLEPHRRIEPAAYEAYLKGRHFWNKRTSEALKRGIDYYRRAIEIDPTYALAHVGIAECYNVLGFQGLLSPKDSFSPAIAAANRALELDESLAEAHYSLGYASLHHTWDWAKVESSFDKGMSLNPRYPTGYHWHALLFTSLGRRDEAVSRIERAWELDPLAPIIRAAYGWIHYHFREYDACIEQQQKTLEVNPEFWTSHFVLALAYIMKSMYSEALDALQEMKVPAGHEPWIAAAQARALALSGKTNEAKKPITALGSMSQAQYVRPYEFAIAHAALGECDEAMSWLAKAYDERGNWLNYARVDPALDPLRDDPRFGVFLRRIYGDS